MKPTQEELVKRYIKLVYYYTKRWVSHREDIDDMVQETYKKALMHYDTFTYKSENQLKSWLLLICRNTIFDAHKLKKITVPFDDEKETANEQQDEESWLETAIRKENITQIKNLLQQLNEIDSDIIRLRYFEELSFKEIAAILQSSEAVAKMRCYRTLAKMRKEIEK